MHKRTKQCVPKLSICLGLILGFSGAYEGYAAPSPVLQTQSKIKKIELQINKLQHTLSLAHDKRGLLNRELSNTEKQIGEGVRKLRLIKNTMRTKEQKIAALQIKVTRLNEQITAQQKLLASHIRSRYRLGEYQPLKWLITQDDPYQVSRILTYYEYIISSRKQLIAGIDETSKNLNKNKQQLHRELLEIQQLHLQLNQHQQELVDNKDYHTALIHSLNSEIQNKQHALVEYQRDKNNLSRLLKSLAEQSVTQPSKSLGEMRKKLPLPIHTAQHSLRRMNQGVTFFAEEGTIVTAIYPGKVVFSDWLKGYGLLLILDHGHGFMTLYAHNQSLFKSKGESVSQNEQIASVGHSGGIKQNGLYFEIRVKGKAVPPLEWLS